MTNLDRNGPVFVLRLGADENRFDADSLSAINVALDEVDAATGPKALVTTGEGKFFSNGLDLEYMGTDECDVREFLPEVHRMLGRFLTIGAPTAAAINGHAFAGGAMLASAHDYRVMRADRGFWCIPEIDLGMRFTPGMNDLLQARVPGGVLHRAMLTGERFGGSDAALLGIVDAAADESRVLETAIAWAEANSGHAGDVMAAIKRDLYTKAATSLSTGDLPQPLDR